MPFLKTKPIPQPQVIQSGLLKRLTPEDIKPSPDNPRRLFDRGDLDDLKKNIAEHGVLVPITVFQLKGQTKYSILDGERRFRCVVELNQESHDTGKIYDLPANVVEPPTKIAGLLYMFSIHNFREAWELMPTALGLKVVMEDLGERDNKRLSKLTGLSEIQIERCKILLEIPEKFQQMSLDPDPKTRVPSNFWIEAYPVLNKIEQQLPDLAKRLGRDKITEKLVEKYRAKKIRSVIHFRRVMEALDLAQGDSARETLVLRRLEQFVLKPDLDTKSAFDEFIIDRKRIQTAVNLCEQFIAQLQQLRLSNTSEAADRRSLVNALSEVRSYCKSLVQHLRASEDPETTDREDN